ncbi:MAG: SDR family oxidoreductase [Candidatus Aminicenantes bacterium]|jgi:NAD(P)H dehydrogenase (quinone)
MKAAITTASGRLGRAIVKEMITKIGEHNVIGVARSPEKAKDLGIEVRRGDYNNESDFVHAFRGVEVALIVSGMDAPDIRIQQHRNVIEGAKKSGVRKIVYTSIYGREGKSMFDAIIKSNRQTEKDIQAGGLEWAIGRNGLYIDADFEAIPDYKKEGIITNCAADGKCAYTSRAELARAYGHLIMDDSLNGQIYNLCGEAITQQELTDVINAVFNLELIYKPMSVDAYVQDRVKTHGDFLGHIVAGIYKGIRDGAFDILSDYVKVCGKEHQSLTQMAEEFKANGKPGVNKSCMINRT